MALGQRAGRGLEPAFHDLRELKVDVAYPFLLELYHDYASGALSAADFAAAVRLVEAYVFRRAICAIPTNSMNKTFATFGKALKKDRYLESIQAHFLRCRPIAAFPVTRSFGATCTPATSTTSEAAATGCAGWRTTAARSVWRWTSTPSSTSCRRTRTSRRRGSRPSAGVGARAAAVAAHARQPHAHRLQRRVQRPPFAEKRDMTGGFKESPLKLNAGLGQLDAWNEAAIKSAPGGLPIRRSPCGPRPSSMPQTSCRLSAEERASDWRLHHRRPSSPAHGAGMREALRGLPQGGARARSLRDRGVSEAVRGLQGRDELRRCGAAGQAAAPDPQHALRRDQRPERAVQGRHGHRPLGQRRCGGRPQVARRAALRHGPRAPVL